jgi:hypothetical protein
MDFAAPAEFVTDVIRFVSKTLVIAELEARSCAMTRPTC